MAELPAAERPPVVVSVPHARLLHELKKDGATPGQIAAREEQLLSQLFLRWSAGDAGLVVRRRAPGVAIEEVPLAAAVERGWVGLSRSNARAGRLVVLPARPDELGVWYELDDVEPDARAGGDL